MGNTRASAYEGRESGTARTDHDGILRFPAPVDARIVVQETFVGQLRASLIIYLVWVVFLLVCLGFAERAIL